MSSSKPIDRQVGQMPARVLRLLGNRNVLCYSNDGVVRRCRICGRMRGRAMIELGDMVLITLRDFSSETHRPDLKKIKLGDIIGKYEPAQYDMLKVEDGVNLDLFNKIEVHGYTIGELVSADFSFDDLPGT